jgi:hypothetical protein
MQEKKSKMNQSKCHSMWRKLSIYHQGLSKCHSQPNAGLYGNYVTRSSPNSLANPYGQFLPN